jgi:hypothetical protein
MMPRTTSGRASAPRAEVFQFTRRSKADQFGAPRYGGGIIGQHSSDPLEMANGEELMASALPAFIDYGLLIIAGLPPRIGRPQDEKWDMLLRHALIANSARALNREGGN